MYSCSLFCSLPLIFTLGAASISHFLTAAIKFSCYSYDEIGLLCFLSLASSFSVIHVSLDIKIKSKEPIGFVVVIFSLKVRVAMHRRNARVFEMQNFNPAYMKGVDVRTCSVRKILPEPKFLGCIDHQIFLPMVLRYPRESSAKNVLISIWHAKFKLSASPRATPLVRLRACLHGGGGPHMWRVTPPIM